MSGQKTYCLPNTDIEVDVDYTYNKDDGVCFDDAYIGGEHLPTNLLYIKDAKGNYITLTAYFQEQLDNDESEIADDEAAGIAEARADERAGR